MIWYPTGDDDSRDHRNQSDVSQPGLSSDGGEEGGGGADSLIEADGQVLEGNVATNSGGAENEAESGYLNKMNPRS